MITVSTANCKTSGTGEWSRNFSGRASPATTVRPGMNHRQLRLSQGNCEWNPQITHRTPRHEEEPSESTCCGAFILVRSLSLYWACPASNNRFQATSPASPRGAWRFITVLRMQVEFAELRHMLRLSVEEMRVRTAPVTMVLEAFVRNAGVIRHMHLWSQR
jgi:hypothetical protein